MPLITITVSETIEVPDGSELVMAPTGMLSGIRLPSGDFIKPWIKMEHYAAGREDGDPEGDLSTAELNALDVIQDITFERTAEIVDGDVAIGVATLNRAPIGAPAAADHG